MAGTDQTLAYLLDLDGEEIVYEEGYVARFKAKAIDATPEKPHGVSYSLTLHAPGGQRLLGYDNAHRVGHRGSKYVEGHATFDHWHRDQTDSGRPYTFVSAEKLMADFFDEVARILKERNDG